MLKNPNSLFVEKADRNFFDTPLFKLKIYKKGKFNNLRIIVSKKIDKRSVVRNRTKRVYKKAVNELLLNEKIKGSLSIIVKKSAQFTDVVNIEKNIKEIILTNFK